MQPLGVEWFFHKRLRAGTANFGDGYEMEKLRVGIAGLGAASALVLPCFDDAPGVELAAAADLRPAAREAFANRYGLPAFDSVEALCAWEGVDAIWVETPNHLHCEHVLQAARFHKHAICAKPVGVTLDECDRMIAATGRAGVQLLQGHSKVFDPPVRKMREIVASGRLGAVVHIDTLLHNDWLQRPRLEAELDPAAGGGIVLRQGPHQIDIVRYIVGHKAAWLRSSVARGDPEFHAEGHYSVLMGFESGATASISLVGYGWFDSNELNWNIGVSGKDHGDLRRRTPKARRTGPLNPALKYGAAAAESPAFGGRGEKQPFFGLTIVTCERGTIRQSPDGLFVYSAVGCEEILCPPDRGRAAELLELRDALAAGRTVFPDGLWGKATLEACLAIRQSALAGADVRLQFQTTAP